MERIDKINYYLDIAETVIERGTCLRRNFGAIIVKNDEIISKLFLTKFLINMKEFAIFWSTIIILELFM